MSKTQRTLYFAGICVAILAIGILMLLFTARTAHAAVLYDYSNLDGSSAPIQSSGGPNMMLYGQGGTYGFGGPHMSGAIAFIKFQLAAGYSTCPSSNTVYLNAGTNSFALGSATYNSGDNTCTYSISTATLKAVHFTPGGFTGNDGIYLNTSSNSDLDLADGNTGGINTVGRSYAFQVCDSGGCSGGFVPPTPPDSTTSIVITNPTQGTSTPSTTFDIDVDYNIGTDLSSFSLDGSLPTRIGLQLTLFNAANQQQINLGTDFTIASTTGPHTYATTTTQAASDYTLQARLVGVYGTNIPAPPDCTPLPPFQTCTGTTESTADLAVSFAPTFSVDNGLFPILGFQIGSTTSRAGLATTTCSVIAIGGCFQNALAFLFYPSPGILDQFRFLWSLIQNKPPFGYVSQTITGLRSLNASSTPAFSFGSNLPLVGTIFTPFRTGLAGILWVGFFIAWYRGRLRHLDI